MTEGKGFNETRLDLPVVVNIKTTERCGKLGFQMSSLAKQVSNSKVSREQDPTVKGWTTQWKQKNDLVCGISVKQEIKSVHCLTERYARHALFWK